jgi:predicted transcriptional regulator
MNRPFAFITTAQIARAQEMRDERDENDQPRYSTEEIAEFLGVSRTTVRTYTTDPADRGVRVFTPRQIEMVKVLLAQKKPDGTRRFTQRDVAALACVQEMTISRIARGRTYQS